MTTALAAAAIVPAVVATPAQAAEAEVTFAKAYYTTANGTAAFTAGELGGVIASTTNKEVTYLEGSNGEVFTMTDYSGYLAANPTATPNEVLTALSKLGKALSADQVKALNVKEGKVEGGKVTVDADAPVGDVKVESVKAINPTTIQVTLNKDLTTEQANKANFTLSKGTIEAIKVEGKVATLSVKGLTFGNTTTVTVGSPAYTAEVTVPQVNELYVLEVTTDAANDTIKSDGATKTQLTVVLKDRTTGEIVEKDGVIQFQATRGGLGQTTSALQNGKATVQLTSVASATSMTSIVTATVSDVPGAAEFEGLTAQKAVIFSPEATEQGEVKFVQAVSAESTQGDRLFVTFSDKIKAEDYKKALGNAPDSDAYGINIDDHPVAVSDVVNKTENTLEFILDVDSANGSGHKRIENDWGGLGTATENYLRDNVTHKVTFPSNVGTVVLANTTGINFILTDTSRPAVLGVTAKDQLEFNVRFTESVDESTVEGAPENFLIDGREVVINSAANAADIVKAKNENKIIVTSLKVGEYTFDKDGKPVDQRNIVTFKVHKDFALTEGVHQIQVAKVTDWAGDVDPVQNTVATDTFDFSVTADKSVPTPTIEVQSPEQWKVTFDKEVYGTTGKKIKDVFAIKSADSNDSFVMDTDYIVSWINEDGTDGGKLNHTADASTLNGKQHFLIEFKQDWTVKYNTNNNPEKTYFASTKNPYTVTVDNVESVIGNKMAKQDLDVKLSYDGVSPTIAEAKQIEVNGTLTSDVSVKMSEPVKNVATMNNNETLTPSEQQSSTGVPVPTYEFVKGDKVVKATANNGSYDNYGFTLTPDSTLEAGEWTLYIRSISDDIGNTSATVSQKVTIAATEQQATSTRMAWAAFDDALGAKKLLNGSKYNGNDVIYVKFTKEMKADGANGVSRTQNYVFMGQPLPAGSQVLKGIAGVTNDWDGVTIVMPANTWNGTGTSDNDFTNALNIASNFVSADGEALSGAYEVELTDTATTQSDLEKGFEATYTDAGTSAKANQVTFGGAAAVKGATVETAGIANGKIDTIKLTLDAKHGAIAANTEVLVNGKTFETSSAVANAGTVTLTAKTANDQIEGTTTSGLKITGQDGSIIVNTGSVVDEAAPVITKAELNGDKITLTFSEAVTKATDGTFQELLGTDFTLANASVATISAIEHKEASANKVVLTVSNGTLVTTASTIAATVNVKDFANVAATITGVSIDGTSAPITTVNPTLTQVLQVGETTTGTLANTGTAVTKEYTSATPSVATVTNAGVVTALTDGTSVISYVGKDVSGNIVETGSITVTVHAAASTNNPTVSGAYTAGGSAVTPTLTTTATDKAFTLGTVTAGTAGLVAGDITLSPTTGEFSVIGGKEGTFEINYVGKDASGVVVDKGSVNVTVTP